MSQDKDGSKNDAQAAITQEQFDELKANFDKMSELVKAKDDSITALEGANKTLVGEKRDEESAKEKARVAKLSADGKHDEILKEQQDSWTAERQTLTDNLNRVTNQMNGITGDGVLKASLKQVGVSNDMLPVVESHFRSTWTFDEGTAMHDGKLLADSVKSWATSDAGKPFITSDNSGSGAKPSTSTTSSTKKWEDMTFEERKDFSAED